MIADVAQEKKKMIISVDIVTALNEGTIAYHKCHKDIT